MLFFTLTDKAGARALVLGDVGQLEGVVGHLPTQRLRRLGAQPGMLAGKPTLHMAEKPDKPQHGPDRVVVITLRALTYFVHGVLVVIGFALKALGADPTTPFAA